MKKITLFIAFIFGIIATGSAQFLQNFDAGLTIPAGWTVINQGGTNTWNIGPPQGFDTPPAVAISGTNTARITFNTTTHDDYLITPQITPAAGVNDRLSFWAKNYGPTYHEHYEVLISTTDASASANFSIVLQPDTAAPDAWGKSIIDLTPYLGQPIYIAFRALSTDQFYLCFDDIANDTAPAGAPNCDSVLSTPANNATNANLSGNLTWSFATGDPTGYNLTVGTTSGGSEVLPLTDVGNVTTYNVGALLPATTYYVTITPYSANGVATGCTINSFTTFTPPANDDCSGAIALTVNSDLACGTVTAGSVLGATASTTNAASCFGTEDDDVWFSFVATATSHPISLLNAAGSTTDLFHSLWTGPDCDNLTLVPGTCSDPNNSTPVGLTVGDTYYLRVYTYTSTVGQTSTFNVCIGSLPPPPANDDCANAVNLAVGSDFISGKISVYNLGATTSPELPFPADGTVAPNNCGGLNFATTGKDIWYTITVPSTGTFKVETKNGVGITDTAVQIYSGDCSAFVAVTCDDDTGDGNFSLATISGRTPSEVLYLRVFGYNGAAGAFDLSAYDASLSATTFDETGFTSYPNPVIDILNLSYSKNIDKVQVMNLLGQEVVSKSINATDVKVDMSTLASGTYLVKVTSDNQIKTIKVFKE
jgi:Secretion system C-terminal sorting domain/Cleaved Adhesin Domain